MCTKPPKTPAPITPAAAPAPAPAELKVQAPIIGGDEANAGTGKAALNSKKKGRNSLRIDLAAGSSLGGATGLNIAR